jgi:hypothetical protein
VKTGVRLAGQRDEQVELERRQLHLGAVAHHLVAGDVDRDEVVGRPDRERLGRLVLAGAEPGAQPRDELLGLEGLDDVVVGAALEAQHHVEGVAARGQHHDRHTALRADLPAHLDAVGPRQHEVEQHEVGPLPAEGAERGVAVGDEGRLEPLLAQDDAQHLGQGGVVVDHQHLAHRVLTPRSSSPMVAPRAWSHPADAGRARRAVGDWPYARRRAGAPRRPVRTGRGTDERARRLEHPRRLGSPGEPAAAARCRPAALRPAAVRPTARTAAAVRPPQYGQPQYRPTVQAQQQPWGTGRSTTSRASSRCDRSASARCSTVPVGVLRRYPARRSGSQRSCARVDGLQRAAARQRPSSPVLGRHGRPRPG